MEQLDQLVQQAAADFAAAADGAQLEQAKARYLGKAGSLTERLKSLGIDWIATSAMRFLVSSSRMSSWISVSASDRTSEASSLASSWSLPSLICLTLR